MVSCGFLCSARQCSLNSLLHLPKLRFVVLLLLVLNAQANIIRDGEEQVVPALPDGPQEVPKLDGLKESNEVNKNVEQLKPEVVKPNQDKLSNEVVQEVAAKPEKPKVPEGELPAVPQQQAQPEGAKPKPEAQLPKLPAKPQSKPEEPKAKPDAQLPKLPSLPAKQESLAAAQQQVKPEQPKVKPNAQPAKPEESKVKPDLPVKEAKPEMPKVKPDGQLPKLPSLPAKENAPAKPELPKLPVKDALPAKPKPVAQLPKLPNVVAKVEAQPKPEEPKSKPELPKLPNAIPKEDSPAAGAAADQPEQKPVHPKFPNLVAKEEKELESTEKSEISNGIADEQEQHKEEEQSIEKQKEQVLQKLDDIKHKVSHNQTAQGRIKVVYPSQVYFIEKTTATTEKDSADKTTTEKPTKTEHIHEHYYYKPPLFPFLPPFVSFPSSSDSNGYYSKYPSQSSHYNKGSLSSSSNNKYGNQGSYYDKYGSSSSNYYNKYGNQGSSSSYYPLPLFPIPFWKPSTYSSSSNQTDSPYKGEDDGQLYNYKPFYAYGDKYPPIYISERRLPSETEDHSAEKQNLILVGHIFLTIKPHQFAHKGQKDQHQKVNHTENVKPSAEQQVDSSSQPDIKIEEPFEDAQLLLQPVAYPPPPKNHPIDGNFQPHKIEEIVRSLHLVHPSANQQRSQSAEEGEESAVLFAVEIPKPIYRFFKSVFGVFSY